jgi:hypothetical protein
MAHLLTPARQHCQEFLTTYIPAVRDTKTALFFATNAPHSGQSSQLFVEANDRNAQFLATSAGSALTYPLTSSRAHWRVSSSECSVQQ